MHNSLTESSIWKSAVALFNERVVEVEKEVCDVLRPKLDSAADEPANVIFQKMFHQQEFSKLTFNKFNLKC